MIPRLRLRGIAVAMMAALLMPMFPDLARAEVPPVGIGWTSRNSGSQQWLKGVAQGAGQVVVVGDEGEVLTSPDGQAWSRRAPGAAKNLTDVVYGGGLFVAVGQSGTILSSGDGANWSAHSSDKLTHQLNDLTYGGGLFVTVGDAGTILSSADGTTWTSRTAGTDAKLYGVTYGGGQFVAVGARGTVLTSRDGAAWTSRTAGTARYLSGIAYGNGRFLAVGEEDTVLTSADGTTWSAHKVDSAQYGLWRVAFGDGKFVAVGGAGNILSTEDGASWGRNDTGRVFSFIEDVEYINGQFVAVGNFGTIRTSGAVALKPKRDGDDTTQPQPTAEPLTCKDGKVSGTSRKQQTLAGGIAIMADFATKLASGKVEYCGNITLNEYVKLDGTVTVDPAGLEAVGNGTIYMESDLPHFHGVVTIYSGEFKINGDVSELIKKYGANQLELAGMKVEIKKLRFVRDGIHASGELSLPAFAGGKPVKIDNLKILKGIPETGKITLPAMSLGNSVLSLKKATAEFDFQNNLFKGSAELTVRDQFGIEGALGFKEGHLEQVGFGLSGTKIAVGTTGFFLTKVYGELDGLTDLSSLKLKAKVNVLAGPEIKQYAALKGVDVTLLVDLSGRVKVSGTFKLVEIATLEGGIDVNVVRGYVEVTADLNVVDIIIGDGRFKVSGDGVYGEAKGVLQIPKKVPLKGGEQLAGTEMLVDKTGFTGTILLANWAKVKCTVDWTPDTNCDASFHVRGMWSGRPPVVASTGPFLAALPAPQSFDIPAGIEQMLVLLTWESGNASFNLQTPDGTIITPADAPMTSLIARYEKSQYRNEAYYLLIKPKAGKWTPIVTADSTYTVQFLEIAQAPGLTFTAPAADMNAAGPVTIRWETNAQPGSTIDLFYARERGELGTRLAEDVSAAAGSFTWTPSGVATGTYYIYGIVDDGKAAPEKVYAPGRVRISNPDLPASPKGLTARAVNGKLELGWTANTEPDLGGYRLYLVNQPGADSVPVGQVTAYTWAGLKEGQTYQVAITAYDTEGYESEPSAPVSVHLTVPARPSLTVKWPGTPVTNQASVTVAGQIGAGATGTIYRDDEMLAGGLTGSFRQAVTLTPGRNRLRLVAATPNGDAAEEAREYYLDQIRPQLTVAGLQDGMQVNDGILRITGTVELTAELTLNGSPVTVSAGGAYTATLPLQQGANQVDLVARDEAGNENVFRGTVISSSAVAPPTAGTCGSIFPDVKGTHGACAAIEKLAGMQVLGGYLDGTFQPDKSVTRAEFAKMLVVALGKKPDPTGALRFSDTGAHWAGKQGYLQGAVALGAISGFPDGSFQPDQPVTRAQVVKIAAAAGGMSPMVGATSYTDIASQHWYAGWVDVALRTRLIGATAQSPLWAGSSFDADREATRAEAAMILANLLAGR